MDLGLEPSAFGSPVPHSRGSGSLSSRTSGSKTIKGAVAGIFAEGGRGGDGRFGSPRGKTQAQRAVVTPERGQGVAAGDGLSGPVAAAGDKSTDLGSEGVQAEGSGVVGHVWMSLKLRDPSILLMRVVRQWNMARDEASVQQRRVAQAEAKR